MGFDSLASEQLTTQWIRTSGGDLCFNIPDDTAAGHQHCVEVPPGYLTTKCLVVKLHM